jgi:tripartite-type tricarboxylate transporter receptor subunit TctC
MGPAGLPSTVVATLSKAIQDALASPELRESYAKAGSTPLPGTPEQLRMRYLYWMEVFEKIARESGVKPQ